MFFRKIIWAVLLLALMSCSQFRKMEMIRSGEVKLSMTLPEDEEEPIDKKLYYAIIYH